MASVGLLRRVISSQLPDLLAINALSACQIQSSRNAGMYKPIAKPKSGIEGKAYRRIVHFKDKYTVEPLEVTNIAGRDPVTGRVVAKGIGGGIKHKYHWIHWVRDGPSQVGDAPKLERVLNVFKDGCRTSHVALVGSGRELRYYLATENMKRGMLIKTTKAIPRNPVRAMEGDTHPLGALPLGTKVHCVEKYPGVGGFLVHAAGTQATVLKKTENGRVIVQVPSKRTFSLDPTCLATVGRLSNVEHGTTHVGSAQANRLLGNRPRSGLWQRKTGRHGRKIRALPPTQEINSKKDTMNEVLELTLVV